MSRDMCTRVAEDEATGPAARVAVARSVVGAGERTGWSSSSAASHPRGACAGAPQSPGALCFRGVPLARCPVYGTEID
jgi:hypothetical protein